MPDIILIIDVGGSAFRADLADLQPWRALLDNADAIALAQDGSERMRVELDGLKRWIAFARNFGGSPFACIGHQETVGARVHGGVVTGGSNRKVLAWLHPGGQVTVGSSPFLGARQ